MIYTIGYHSITIKDLTKIMDERDINLLVDIRSIPYSRFKYDFNKNRLIERFGKRYTWMPICGGKNGPVKSECLKKLIEIQADILLMCMEDDPAKCHRYSDVGKRLKKYGIECVHLVGSEEKLHLTCSEEENPKLF